MAPLSATYPHLAPELALQYLNLSSDGSRDTIEVSEGDQSIFVQEVFTGWEEARHGRENAVRLVGRSGG